MARVTRKAIAQSIQMQAPFSGPNMTPDWIAKAAAAKPRAKPRNIESALQKQCCQWLALQKDVLYFSVPNHFYLGSKNPGKAAAYISRQKQIGMLPGVSDLVIVLKGPRIIFAELKAPKGVLSDNQESFLRTASALGCHAAVIRSLEDLMQAVKIAAK